MKVKLENFRNICMDDFYNLKNLNLVIGKNSSGKSTFLRFFPLIKQSLEREISNALLWYGNYVDFGSFEETIENSNSKIFEGLGSFIDDILDFAFGEKLKSALEEKKYISQLKNTDGINRDIAELTAKIELFENDGDIFSDALKNEWIKIIKSLYTFRCAPNMIA